MQVPHGSLGKGSGVPKDLARCHVLVAKVLTNSDTHGRIILPRVSVEANLAFLMGYRQASPLSSSPYLSFLTLRGLTLN